MTDFALFDSHIHFSSHLRWNEFRESCDRSNVKKSGIVSLPDRDRINFNPEALFAKAREPKSCYALLGLDYRARFQPERHIRFDGGAQVETLAGLGADGLKMWAGKPSFQATLGFALDGPQLGEVFDAAAAAGLPVVLHVADPPVFWERDDGRRMGWQAGAGAIPSFSELQTQTENMLSRHPQTTFIFPHLLFRAGNLKEFTRFMERFPNAFLDLSPGLYFYAELSQKPPAAREFFSRFRERVLFGTDGFWFDPGHPALPWCSMEENTERTERLYSFLATDRKASNPFSFTSSSIPEVKGLELEPEILKLILRENAERLLGLVPRALAPERVNGYLRMFEASLADRKGSRADGGTAGAARAADAAYAAAKTVAAQREEIANVLKEEAT